MFRDPNDWSFLSDLTVFSLLLLVSLVRRRELRAVVVVQVAGPKVVAGCFSSLLESFAPFSGHRWHSNSRSQNWEYESLMISAPKVGSKRRPE